jgi:hypothetical protein
MAYSHKLVIPQAVATLAEQVGVGNPAIEGKTGSQIDFG